MSSSTRILGHRVPDIDTLSFAYRKGNVKENTKYPFSLVFCKPKKQFLNSVT